MSDKKCKITSPDDENFRWVKFCSSYENCHHKDIDKTGTDDQDCKDLKTDDNRTKKK